MIARGVRIGHELVDEAIFAHRLGHRVVHGHDRRDRDRGHDHDRCGHDRHRAVRSSCSPCSIGQAGCDVLVFPLVGFFFGGAVGVERRLTIGDRDAVIVGMDFAEGQEAVAIAAIFDERRLQRRLDARHLGEIDVAFDLLFCGSLEIKFFETLAIQYDDPGLFRMRRIDEHALCHSYELRGARPHPREERAALSWLRRSLCRGLVRRTARKKRPWRNFLTLGPGGRDRRPGRLRVKSIPRFSRRPHGRARCAASQG